MAKTRTKVPISAPASPLSESIWSLLAPRPLWVRALICCRVVLIELRCPLRSAAR